MDMTIFFSSLAALAIAERFPSLCFERSRFFRRFFLTDLFCLLSGAMALSFVVRAGAARLAGAPTPPSLDWPLPIALAVVLVLYDLGAYLSHYLLHRFDPLWELHKVHHSSLKLDWLATFRAHLLEHALRHVLSPALLILLGFPVPVVGLAAALYAGWAAFNHSNLRLDLGFLEPLLITPRLHRMHHVPVTSEHNLGTVLSLWDRLRGVLVTDPGARLAPLGVPGALDTYPQTWLAQQREPFRRRGDGRLAPVLDQWP
jgi:sterol desaturase/sphingolipid hydroxylase (fatty acid hydroxylase superfamily)